MVNPTLTAQDLRRLGETADGGRDVDQSLVIRTTTGSGGVVTTCYAVVPTSEMNQSSVDFELAPIPKSVRQKFPREKIKLTVQFADGSSCQVPAIYDSIFLTDSSFEKFLYGYYEQLRIRDDSYLQAIKDQVRDPDYGHLIVAILHKHPSDSILLKDDGTMYVVDPSAQQPGRCWVTMREFAAFISRQPRAIHNVPPEREKPTPPSPGPKASTGDKPQKSAGAKSRKRRGGGANE